MNLLFLIASVVLVPHPVEIVEQPGVCIPTVKDGR